MPPPLSVSAVLFCSVSLFYLGCPLKQLDILNALLEAVHIHQSRKGPVHGYVLALFKDGDTPSIATLCDTEESMALIDSIMLALNEVAIIESDEEFGQDSDCAGSA
jgi:hypothetical protein